MRLADFEAMVRRMAHELPPDFLAGVAEIAVSPRAVPHPDREEIFTLGECIPLPAAEGGSPEGVQSRIVLYYGSFVALAQVVDGFDWREEAWETLTHELRHHLESLAREDALEGVDYALDETFKRDEGLDARFLSDFHPKGQMADYRYALTDGRGIHVREYDGTYAVHWDEVDPSVNVVGHLVRDAPGVVLLGALALGLILGALEG